MSSPRHDRGGSLVIGGRCAPKSRRARSTRVACGKRASAGKHRQPASKQADLRRRRPGSLRGSALSGHARNADIHSRPFLMRPLALRTKSDPQRRDAIRAPTPAMAVVPPMGALGCRVMLFCRSWMLGSAAARRGRGASSFFPHCVEGQKSLLNARSEHLCSDGLASLACVAVAKLGGVISTVAVCESA